MDGEPNFAKACSGWAFWLGFSLGEKMSLYGSQAYVGYCGDIGYFKSLPEGRKRGERKHGNREAASFFSRIQVLGLSDTVIHFRLQNLKWDLSRTASTLEIKRQNKCKGNNS